MSWLGDLLNNNDPFLKFIIRLAFILLLVVGCYVGYSLMAGKQIQFASKKYGILDSIADKRQRDSVKTDHIVLKVDTTKKEKINPNSNISTNKFDKLLPKPKHIILSHKTKNLGNSEQTSNTTSFPGNLTENEKVRIKKIMDEFVGNNPHPYPRIIMYYNSGNSADVAYQLRNYLELQGYDFLVFKLVMGKMDDGFALQNIQKGYEGKPNIDIFIGSVDTERPITIKE